MLKMSFDKNLKVLRESQNLTQKQLAVKINTTLQSISHWETGYTEPSIQQLIALADLFDITIDELVGRTM